jgi:hypothetical protein
VQLTIAGAGASTTILDANYLDRYFAIQPCTPSCENSLSISDVTVEHGDQNNAAPSDQSSVSEYGGAFYNDGSLTISDSVLSDDAASDDGGAVYSDTSATATSISNSTLEGNSAEGTGGAVFVKGGTLAISDDQIMHNNGDYAPAVGAYTGVGPITVTGSRSPITPATTTAAGCISTGRARSRSQTATCLTTTSTTVSRLAANAKVSATIRGLISGPPITTGWSRSTPPAAP